MTMQFFITQHDHLPGVRLSLCSDFTNIPFPDDDAAARDAQRRANGRPFTIERRAFAGLREHKGA